MNLNQKIILGFLAVSLFSAIVGYVGFASMKIVSNAVGSMECDNAPPYGYAETAEPGPAVKAAIDRSLASIFIILVISMVSAVALGVIYARAITRPMRDIKRASEKMKSGYSGVKKLNVASNDELGDIENTFNTMVDDVKKRDEEILLKNRELEKSKNELEIKVAEMGRFNKLAVGRELKMIELKKRIAELEKKERV